MPLKLQHYYHVYANGDWEQIVNDHFKALWNSGLMLKLDKLVVGLVGSPLNRESAITCISELAKDAHWQIGATAEFGYEQETQDYLYSDAVEAVEPFLVLYAHTKGASDRSPINEVWRKAMTRYCVYRWVPTVELLETSDNVAAGCFWAPFNNGRDLGIDGGTQYFAGTFWWAKSEVIAEIGPPERLSRFGAEAWIGKAVTEQGLRVENLLNAPLTVSSLRAYAF